MYDGNSAGSGDGDRLIRSPTSSNLEDADGYQRSISVHWLSDYAEFGEPLIWRLDVRASHPRDSDYRPAWNSRELRDAVRPLGSDRSTSTLVLLAGPRTHRVLLDAYAYCMCSIEKSEEHTNTYHYIKPECSPLRQISRRSGPMLHMYRSLMHINA